MQERADSGLPTRKDDALPTRSPQASGDSAVASNSNVGLRSPPGLEKNPKPPLGPRRATLGLIGEGKGQKSPTQTLRVPHRASRPSLQSTATTALSFADTQTQLQSDGSQRTPTQSLRSVSSRPSLASLRLDTPAEHRSRAASEAGETASVYSLAPTVGAGADAESILGDLLVTDQRSPGWKFLHEPTEKKLEAPVVPFDTGEPKADFNREFDEIPDIDPDGSNEGMPSFPYEYCES